MVNYFIHPPIGSINTRKTKAKKKKKRKRKEKAKTN